MLCCFDSYSDPKSAYNRQASNDILASSYPGQRRFASTGGNALVAAAPPQGSLDLQQPQPAVSKHPPQGDLVSGKWTT